MEAFELNAEPREALGKGATRRLRRAGHVPAVIYGGDSEPQAVMLAEAALRKQTENEAFFSHILTVNIGTDKSQAVVKTLQRDPASGRVTHVDLLRVSSTQELHMNVPLHFINEEDCVGRKLGGVINHLLVDVEIGCLPKDLPEFIEVDMAALDIGDSIHLSELTVPDGVRLMALAHDSEHDPTVVSVAAPQKLDEEEAGEGEDEVEGAEGAAATDEAAEDTD